MADLNSTGGVTEATALNVKDLVVRALVGRDGVDGWGGTGGGGEGEGVRSPVALQTLRQSDTRRSGSGDAMSP